MFFQVLFKRKYLSRCLSASWSRRVFFWIGTFVVFRCSDPNWVSYASLETLPAYPLLGLAQGVVLLCLSRNHWPSWELSFATGFVFDMSRLMKNVSCSLIQPSGLQTCTHSSSPCHLSPVVPSQAAPHPVSWRAAGEQLSGGIWRSESHPHVSEHSNRHFVVPKVGSFTRCAVCQYPHRAEALSLLHICADMDAGW